MTVQDVLNQITAHNGKIISKSSGKEYEVEDFINQICEKLNFTKKQRKELESHFVDYLRPQSDQSKYVENIIEKYNFQFSDGVYFVNGQVISLADIYRLMWKNEKLLPTETDSIIENIEKISEEKDLQSEIFEVIKSKAVKGQSEYLKSLYDIYPEIEWRCLLYNIIVPHTKPLFHIFYDDGVGGTGKSTLLEVITKIVGEKFTSNVLLDQFGNRFIFSNMLGKYINVGDDNGKNDELQNVGTLKSIITGNRVTIDRKNIQPIEVRIFAKQLFATNILPYIDFTDGGIMRRLNIVPMNKVIPKGRALPKLDDVEISHLIYEILTYGKDLESNNNELAITSSPLYRAYTNVLNLTYDTYKNFCADNGFKCMNIINFEVKSKFIKDYCRRKVFTPKRLMQEKFTINPITLQPLTPEELKKLDELDF